MSSHSTEPEHGAGWSPRVEKLWWAICAICVLLVLADLFYNKHGHYAFEGLIGFHGIFGFIAFVFVVLAGTRMRDFLMRDEDYYEDDNR